MTMPGFWQQLRQDNRNVVLTGFGQLSRVWYVFPQGGGPRGSFDLVSDLLPNLQTRDTIVIGGVIREQVVVPEYVHDVTVIGATNRAYQATDSGVPIQTTGNRAAGASWLPPTSPAATTPLIELTANNVGWQFHNIEFAPPSDDAAIKITNGGSGIGSSHHVINGCMFLGGLIGIEDNGGFHNVLVEESLFHGHTGAGGGGIVCTSTSNAVPLRNLFRRNRFIGNQSNFVASQNGSVISDNHFDRATATVIDTIANSGQGGSNHVVRNTFNIVAAEFDPSGSTGLVQGSATDVWYSILMDAVESVSPPA